MLLKLCGLALLLTRMGCATNDGGKGIEHATVPKSSGPDAEVHIPFKQLEAAVVEHNTSGAVRDDVEALRRQHCEGYENHPLVFYKIVVSDHWHYYWVCSEATGRRATSRYGAFSLNHWLQAFIGQAAGLTGQCKAPSQDPILQGVHPSGIRAIAFCNKEIALRFPDGSVGRKTINPPQPTAENIASSQPSTLADRTSAAAADPKPNCKLQPKAPYCLEFAQAVQSVCSRMCRRMHRKCRRLSRRAALCYKLHAHCRAGC